MLSIKELLLLSHFNTIWKDLSFIPGSKTSRKIPRQVRERCILSLRRFPRIEENQNTRAKYRSAYSENVKGIGRVHCI